jgi:transposase
MHIKTILNRIEKFKSFVYGKAQFLEEAGRLILLVEVRPRRNARPICMWCEQPGPGYDTLQERRFEYVPLWGIPVFFVYPMRRVHCCSCGIVTEKVPWGEGKHRLCTAYMWFLARWAKRLSWAEVAEAFQTRWEHVFRSVRWAVLWGLAHRSMDGITAIGVDEVLWRRGHKYLTLVYQLDEGCKRLLWIGRERTEQTFRGFFDLLGEARSAAIRFVCSDMWKPYLDVVAEKAKQALNILDRFHIAATMNKAIDEVRAQEAKALVENGYEPVLKHSRWCLLKRPAKLTDTQDVKLADLLRYNLKTVRAYLLKEDFQFFWDYVSPYWAGLFMDRWCKKVMRSRIEPMKKIARSLRAHRPLILNWFKARNEISLGAVEGFNNKAKVVTRKAYGFRTYPAIEIALYHTLGALPEPEVTHRFC